MSNRNKVSYSVDELREAIEHHCLRDRVKLYEELKRIPTPAEWEAFYGDRETDPEQEAFMRRAVTAYAQTIGEAIMRRQVYGEAFDWSALMRYATFVAMVETWVVMEMKARGLV